MKYMLLIYSPENAWTPEEWKHCVENFHGHLPRNGREGAIDFGGAASSGCHGGYRSRTRWKAVDYHWTFC